MILYLRYLCTLNSAAIFLLVVGSVMDTISWTFLAFDVTVFFLFFFVLINISAHPLVPLTVFFSFPVSLWELSRVFGLANVESLRSPRKVKGPESKGEEHEVRLVRFPRTRKARIYWNKRDITHLFGDANRKLNQLTFAWQARSGEIFRVTSTLGHGSRRNLQSGFFVDGQEFNNLVTWSELGQHYRNVASGTEESRCPSEGLHSRELEFHSSAIESEADSGTVPDLRPEQEVTPANQNFRLSMVGLSPGPGDEVVDELRSDLYSPTIEVLRSQITQCIPQTEEMVSRAIINAFFSEDNDSRASSDSLLSESTSDHFLGPIQFEVDAISQAYDWLRANQSLTAFAEQQEHKLEFLQTQIDAVMLEVSRDRLTATEACQMLLSVACVLGVDVNPLHENTTVLLMGLGKGATETELVSELKWYGEISAAAVSSDGSIGRYTMCFYVMMFEILVWIEHLTNFTITLNPRIVPVCLSRLNLTRYGSFGPEGNQNMRRQGCRLWASGRRQGILSFIFERSR